MKLAKLILSFLAVVCITGCGKNADVIYINGKIHTFDSKNSIVEAAAVKDGKIVFTGTTKSVTEEYSTASTVDLNGNVVIPGLIDTEGSVVEFSKNLNFVNLAAAVNIDQIVSLVKEKVQVTPENEWVGGYGWSEYMLNEEELMKMDKKVLDDISSKHNIYLINFLGNVVWCNSKLLNTLGINKDTQDPPGGEIARNETGEPQGILFDSAVNLVKQKVPETSRDQMMKFVEKGSYELLKYGITEVQDRTISSEGIAICRELIDNGKFPLRLYAVLSAGYPVFEEYIEKGPELNYKDKLTIRAVSIDYDGAFEIQDAAMTKEYKRDPKVKEPYSGPGEIENYFKRSLDKEFQFRVKAVGDDAVSKSLTSLANVLRDSKTKEHRTIIEGVQFINDNDLNKIKELSLLPSIRPDITMNDIVMLPTLADSSFLQTIGRWKDLLNSAGKITTGSDFPFHLINPFIQMYYLTTRTLTDTSVSIPGTEQKISLEDAIRSYTIWAAYASFEEQYKGSIEENKFADMIVLSKDIFADPRTLLEVKVLKTIINGSVVYSNDTSPAGK